MYNVYLCIFVAFDGTQLESAPDATEPTEDTKRAVDELVESFTQSAVYEPDELDKQAIYFIAG